jgi:hypothetical protein
MLASSRFAESGHRPFITILGWHDSVASAPSRCSVCRLAGTIATHPVETAVLDCGSFVASLCSAEPVTKPAGRHTEFIDTLANEIALLHGMVLLADLQNSISTRWAHKSTCQCHRESSGSKSFAIWSLLVSGLRNYRFKLGHQVVCSTMDFLPTEKALLYSNSSSTFSATTTSQRTCWLLYCQHRRDIALLHCSFLDAFCVACNPSKRPKLSVAASRKLCRPRWSSKKAVAFRLIFIA